MLYGVDVHARYQGGLDVPLLARQGYSFLITKCSQGTAIPDVTGFTAEQFRTRYLSWLAQARQAGMIVGLYHWLTATDGAAQARFFHQLVVEAGGPDGMLIMLDCEDDGYGPQMAGWAGEWGRLTNHHPFLIYSGSWWWPRTGGYRGADLTPYLWHSHYLAGDVDTIPDDPATFAARIPADWWTVSYGGWTHPTILQFCARGDAGSLGNNVDLDVTHLTREQLLALTGKDTMTPGELLNTKLGESGPTVGVALQSTYQSVKRIEAVLAQIVARLDQPPTSGTTTVAEFTPAAIGQIRTVVDEELDEQSRAGADTDV